MPKASASMTDLAGLAGLAQWEDFNFEGLLGFPA
jgi:hypothetical protein